MRKIGLGVLIILSTFMAHSMPRVELGEDVSYLAVDDEYNQFRKQGDDFFKSGKYDKALNKYLSCLEIPGFEKDDYALQRVDVCKRAMALQKEIVTKGTNMLDKSTDAVDALLKLNPEDEQVRNTAFAFWVNKGNQAMYQKNWQEASDNFIKALAYKTDADVEKKLQRCENMLVDGDVVRRPVSKTVVKSPSSGVPLKVIMTGVAVGGALYAVSLNNGWQTKIDAITQAQTEGDRSKYQLAYQDAEDYRAKLGIRNASIATAVIAAGVDAFLFVRKPRTAAIQVRPSGVGMSLQVRLQ